MPCRCRYFPIVFAFLFLSLSQFQAIFVHVSFVAISAVLCRCFKAMSLVGILPKQGLSHVVSFAAVFRLVTQLSSFLSLWGGALRDEPKNGSARETINRGVTFEDRYRRQGRNFTTNDSKILDLKSSSEQIFSENWCWVPLRYQLSRIFEKC